MIDNCYIAAALIFVISWFLRNWFLRNWYSRCFPNGQKFVIISWIVSHYWSIYMISYAKFTNFLILFMVSRLLHLLFNVSMLELPIGFGFRRWWKIKLMYLKIQHIILLVRLLNFKSDLKSQALTRMVIQSWPK